MAIDFTLQDSTNTAYNKSLFLEPYGSRYVNELSFETTGTYRIASRNLIGSDTIGIFLPAPTITAFSPSTVISGSEATVSLQGINITDQSVILLNDFPLQTFFVESGTLTAILPSTATMDTTKQYQISVRTPLAISTSAKKPVAVLTADLPMSLIAVTPFASIDTTTFILNVIGDGFVFLRDTNTIKKFSVSIGASKQVKLDSLIPKTSPEDINTLSYFITGYDSNPQRNAVTVRDLRRLGSGVHPIQLEYELKEPTAGSNQGVRTLDGWFLLKEPKPILTSITKPFSDSLVKRIDISTADKEFGTNAH